jgi:hypothetical protein
MGKDCMTFFARFFVCMLLAGVGAAQAEPLTRDVLGAVGGARGERVRVTLWHNDMDRVTMNMMAETFAKADGVFAFAAVPWFAGQQWGHHKMILVARSRTRVGLVEVRGEFANTNNVHIGLHKKVDLRGQLLDRSSREPIANGWIWPAIFKTTPQVWATEPLLPWHAKTDAQGRFVIRGLPEGIKIQALAGGHDHARTWVDIENSTEPVRFEIPRGGCIRGRVWRPDGKPAKRVQVETTSTEGGRGHTLTNDQGEYELRSLAEGTYKVWAEALELTCVAATQLQVQPGETIADGNVQLVHGGFIVGRLVDAKTGNPVQPGPHTDIAMYGPARGDGGSCQCTPVQADGTFRIRAPAGKNRIYLRAANGYNEPTETVEVKEGQDTEVVWQLHRH